MSESLRSENRERRKKDEVRELLARDFEPHEKSRQARYHAGKVARWGEGNARRHHDGQEIKRRFGMKPFVETLRRAERTDPPHPVIRYPSAYLDTLVHLDDGEKWALEEGRLDYFREERNASKPRLDMMEWLAERPDILRAMSDGGTDIHLHSKPGRGKTSFAAGVLGARLPEVNNETLLWCLTLDEMEMLPLAPFTTVCKPAGVSVEVRAEPTSPSLPSVEIALDDVFRDVLVYDSPTDLLEQVVPGGVYGVLPDPKFRDCARLTGTTYNRPQDADNPGEVTPVREWIHALVAARATEDVMLHRTSLWLDELGDLLPLRPDDDENGPDTAKRVRQFPKWFGKLRKKNGSLYMASHSLASIDDRTRTKERWWMTMPRTPVPDKSLAGVPDPPIYEGYPDRLDLGSALVWDSTNFVEIAWPNPFRRYEFEGEISISYPDREVSVDALN